MTTNTVLHTASLVRLYDDPYTITIHTIYLVYTWYSYVDRSKQYKLVTMYCLGATLGLLTVLGTSR